MEWLSDFDGQLGDTLSIGGEEGAVDTDSSQADNSKKDADFGSQFENLEFLLGEEGRKITAPSDALGADEFDVGVLELPEDSVSSGSNSGGEGPLAAIEAKMARQRKERLVAAQTSVWTPVTTPDASAAQTPLLTPTGDQIHAAPALKPDRRQLSQLSSELPSESASTSRKRNRSWTSDEASSLMTETSTAVAEPPAHPQHWVASGLSSMGLLTKKHAGPKAAVAPHEINLVGWLESVVQVTLLAPAPKQSQINSANCGPRASMPCPVYRSLSQTSEKAMDFGYLRIFFDMSVLLYLVFRMAQVTPAGFNLRLGMCASVIGCAYILAQAQERKQHSWFDGMFAYWQTFISPPV
jgi:hypothetical protein